MTQEGFFFNNADEAMAFFEACVAAKADTLEEKMAIMRQMVKDKKARYIRDVSKLTEGKTIIKVTKKGESK